MPLDDRDPCWAARFRMSPDEMDALRRRAEQTVRASYDAATHAMARAGEAADRLSGQTGAAVDRFKTGVQAEIDKALGRPPASTPAKAAPSPRSPPQRPSKRDAARDFGAGVLLDRIAVGEGTGGPGGYDTTFGHGRYDPPGWGKPISGMTLDELDVFQRALASRSNPSSSAVGRYQINRETMGELRKRMGLTGAETFTPDLQERMGRERLKMARWDDYLAGRITRDQVQDRLARGWASVAKADGLSHYGQPVGTTSDQIRAAIDQSQAEAEHLRDLGGDPWTPAWR